MKIRFLATAATAIALTTSVMAADKPHWSYEGAGGPAHWGQIAENFETCEAGDEQSPVDLTNAIKAEPEAIVFHWNKDADWTEVNNGHSIQANSENGGSIELNGKTYKLVQFHFHAPSEHAIDGRKFPMEAHFVHVADDGTIAVLGAMIEGGSDNGLFQKVMDSAPRSSGETVNLGTANPADIIPTGEHFYRYQGSLTTPPCSETVIWTLLKKPLKVSENAIAEFEALYSSNARPLQETGRRYILEH
ncbi:carbonic anhydrase [Roseibium aggregatum]|uniref:Carbonic anhydrase n=1 Tax=Roseibium aggregatum TaxID=187304 RepID=A0A939ECX5_9HYPH|nr:carbonic anhydrase family protein [Roseibium aggregatum]MBN9670865.1 carbonic anhydrase family protein [Roseibium aggregatum]